MGLSIQMQQQLFLLSVFKTSFSWDLMSESNCLHHGGRRQDSVGAHCPQGQHTTNGRETSGTSDCISTLSPVKSVWKGRLLSSKSVLIRNPRLLSFSMKWKKEVLRVSNQQGAKQRSRKGGVSILCCLLRLTSGWEDGGKYLSGRLVKRRKRVAEESL